MDSVCVTELRRNPRKYLRRVAGGESVTVTIRGKPFAVLIPPPDDKRLLAAAEQAGLPVAATGAS